jgi:hypothetical protein
MDKLNREENLMFSLQIKERKRNYGELADNTCAWSNEIKDVRLLTASKPSYSRMLYACFHFSCKQPAASDDGAVTVLNTRVCSLRKSLCHSQHTDKEYQFTSLVNSIPVLYLIASGNGCTRISNE